MLAARTFIYTEGPPENIEDGVTDAQATQIANNLLKVNVFFESKMIKRIVETETYESVGEKYSSF